MQRLELGEVLGGRVAAPHRAQHGVVPRLERNVEVTGHRPRSRGGPRRARRPTWFTSIDESRSRSTPAIAPASRTSRGERVPRLAIAEAPEVDACEHDLADVPARRVCGPRARTASAAGCEFPADERDHAERARERAAVLDLHECACPLEAASACTHPIAPTSPATASAMSSLGRATTVTLPRRRRSAPSRLAAHPVTYTRRCERGRTGDRLAGLRDGLVRHAARVDDRNVPGVVAPRCDRRPAGAREPPGRPRTRPCSPGSARRRSPRAL